jgi:hypothetical protein
MPTGGSARSSHKISTFELRERLKKSRDEAASTDAGDGNAPRLSSERRRSKKIVVKRKDGSFALVNKGGLENKAERKNNVKDSLEKYEINASFRGINKKVSRDPYADDKSLDTLGTSDSMSLSLGNEPPPREPQAALEKRASMFEKRANSSMDLSLDFSLHKGKNSGGGGISTAASGEQWARFKLLGRTGLGEIPVSGALQTLIDRNFEIMRKNLKHISAIRDDMSTRQSLGDPMAVDFQTGHLLDEVLETIDFSAALSELKRDPDTICLNPKVEQQLRDYITVISAMYRDNGFHNFEHASTVLAAVTKLMGLVATPDDMGFADMKYGCGVTNDPWIQFALVFSALVHDVDHAGVSNAQLIKEKSLVAGAYRNRSVAEQNSIELAWNLLMEPCYKEFRDTIFATPSECSRFRGLVVTAVMATDIADKELASLRKDRAAEALNSEVDDPDAKLISQKATYVVETLIQAADISHTIESFSMYKKWNHKLFQEMYDAYKSGRAENDPSEFWYNGEFGFFDFYIVPLCRKLKACGIFEKASEDYFNNAMKNRKTWETLGEGLVAGYIKEYDEQKMSDTKKRPESRDTAATVQSDDTYDSEDSPLKTNFDSFRYDSEPESENIFVTSPQPRKFLRGSKVGAAQAKKETKKMNPPRCAQPESPIRVKRIVKPSRSASDEGKKLKKAATGKETRQVRRTSYRSKSGDLSGDTKEPLKDNAEKRRIRSKSVDPETSRGRVVVSSKSNDALINPMSQKTTRRSNSTDAERNRARKASDQSTVKSGTGGKKVRLRSKSLEPNPEARTTGEKKKEKEKEKERRGSKKTKPKTKKIAKAAAVQ